MGDGERGEQAVGDGGRGEQAPGAGGSGKGWGGLLKPSIIFNGDLGLNPNSLEFTLFMAKVWTFPPGEGLLVLGSNISSHHTRPREQLASLVEGSSLSK